MKYRYCGVGTKRERDGTCLATAILHVMYNYVLLIGGARYAAVHRLWNQSISKTLCTTQIYEHVTCPLQLSSHYIKVNRGGVTNVGNNSKHMLTFRDKGVLFSISFMKMFSGPGVIEHSHWCIQGALLIFKSGAKGVHICIYGSLHKRSAKLTQNVQFK